MAECYFELFDRAYSLLSDVTPRRFDCGTLCASRCCKDLRLCGREETGMLLLPHEKDYLMHLGADTFSFAEGEDSPILICDGKCDRKLRPFACRIFPYYAALWRPGMKIKPDIRAVGVCPLLIGRKYRRPSVYFIRNAKAAVRILSKCPEIRDDFLKTEAFIDELTELYTGIFGK